MWEPLDYENLTDDQKRMMAHPEIGLFWLALIVLALLACALAIFYGGPP